MGGIAQIETTEESNVTGFFGWLRYEHGISVLPTGLTPYESPDIPGVYRSQMTLAVSRLVPTPIPPKYHIMLLRQEETG